MSVCVYTQHRDWELIKVTDTRIYVHETLSVTEDYDQDGVPTVRYNLSRPNFYEITPYYDNDFDRDGYPNDVDAFPTIETEWLDSDGDGIGDNGDPDVDPDGDGIPNSSDAFPQQAVASVDTDGDGLLTLGCQRHRAGDSGQWSDARCLPNGRIGDK